jgi:glycosidase
MRDRVADLRLTPVPGREYYPSPPEWRDQVGYSVFIDRFAHARFRAVVGDPADGETRHGGNLPGVTSRLDYLQELGVTLLQLSPVVLVDPSCYHHYAPRHLTRVDPHLGTLDDLVDLVAQAHRRGIRVLFDLTVNHMDRVFEYPDGDHFRDEPAAVDRLTIPVGPEEFADPARYTRRGVIQDWKHPVQAVRGDFPPGYRRLASEDPQTAELLIRIAKWWLRTTDIDGFRVDAIRHLDPAFVTRLVSEVKEYAASLGKHDFFMLGEYSATDDAPIADCLRLGVDSVYNYPEYRRQSWALHGQAPTLALQESLLRARAAWGQAAHDRAVRFIDNHDVYRFLRNGEPEGRLLVALAFLAFSTGLPMLYYGTEQGFRQSTNRLERECSADRAAPRNREDMFADGAFVSPSSAGDRFDTTSPTFVWTRRLVSLRSRLVALRRGHQTPRFADSDGPGLYAFSRHTPTQEVLVVLNTSEQPRRATVPVGPLLANQPVLVDALEGRRTGAYVDDSADPSEPAGFIVELPGHGVSVFTAPGAAG